MVLVAAVPLLVAAALARLSPSLAERLPPATAVRLLLLAGTVTAAAGVFALAALGATVAGQDAEVAEIGHWSASAVHRIADFPTPIGVAAGVAAAVVVAATLRRLGGLLRSVWAADRACARIGHHVDGLVIVDDERPDAYAIQGVRGRIVVTTGMLTALSPAERRVLLAHERSHLRHRHTLHAQLLQLAATANPLLRPLVRALRTGIERWADEDAARAVGDRELAARAVARAALVASAAAPGPAAVTAALGMGDTAVVARARALLAPPPRPRRALAAVLVAATVAAAGSAVAVEHLTEHTFERAGAVGAVSVPR